MRCFVLYLGLLFSFAAQGQDIHVFQFSDEQGLESNNVTALLQDSRGIFWVGTQGGGVFQFDQGRFKTIPELTQHVGPNVISFCELDNGNILIRTPSDILIYDGRIATSAKDNQPQCQGIPKPFAQNFHENILSSCETGLGDVWLGTDLGLRYFSQEDSSWQNIVDTENLLNDAIQAITYDRDNTLWIGTQSNGLLQYIGPTDQTPAFTMPYDIKKIEVNDITNEVFTLNSDGHVDLLNLKSRLVQNTIADSVVITNFFIDGLGHYWYNIKNQTDIGIQTNWNDTTINYVKLDSELRLFSYDRFNTIWVETIDGQLLHGRNSESNQFQLFRSSANTPDDRTIELIPKSGNILYRIGEYNVGNIVDNRYEELYASKDLIRSAFHDKSKNLWLGFKGKGLTLINENGSVKSIELPLTIRNEAIYFIYIKDQILWLGTNRSLWQIKLSSKNEIIQLTELLKFKSRSLNQSNYAISNDQSIYIHDESDIYHLQLQGFTPELYTPRVFISSVYLKDQELSKYGSHNYVGAYAKQLQPFSLSYRENTLTLIWEGLSTVAKDLTYSYRLNPDEAWSLPSDRTAIQLSDLRSGSYQFDIKVCDSGENCASLDSAWVFEIRKAFWQRIWFWPGIAFLFLTVIIVGVRIRESRIRRKAESDLAKVKSELQLMELEEKARQLQMNPHFIFNAIQTIQNQLSQKKVIPASQNLVRFSTLMRSILEMSQKDVVSLEDELEFLQAYVEVEQLCRSENIEFSTTLAHNVEPFDVMIPPMLLQPIIENALRYGGPKIEFNADIIGRYLLLKISDNGSGFSEGDINKTSSIALDLLQKRIQHMPGNGNFKHYNRVENNHIVGACVEIKIAID